MKYIDLIIDRNFDRSFGFGVQLYAHRHMKNLPLHFHVLFTIGLWFFEFQFGREI